MSEPARTPGDERRPDDIPEDRPGGPRDGRGGGADEPPAAAASRVQQRAAAPHLNVFVSANAGSGKTRVLVDRVARLLLAGAPPDRVLCLTYTKAAAAEMQGRLYKTLGRWAVLSDADLTTELAALEPERAPSGHARLRSARALFARALETPGGLKVQTIHAFCERLLRRFPLEAGVEPGFEILDEAQTRDVAGRARRGVTARAHGSGGRGGGDLEWAFTELAARLDDARVDGLLSWAAQNRAALSATLARCGGLEGAAAALAGKMHIAADATPDGERRRGWEEAPHDSLRRALDALAAGGKADVKLAEGLRAALHAPDPLAAWAAYSRFLFTEDGAGDPRSRFGNKDTVESAPVLARLFGSKEEGRGEEIDRMHRARERVRAAEVLAVTRAGLAVAEAYAQAYEAEKGRRHALDFADLVEAVRRLLTRSESADWVRYKLDNGVDHVLVDEAQDTAPEQWDVIDALTAEFFAGAGARDAVRTMFVVGDEKQSIYSFQGADPARFLAARRGLGERAAAGGARFEALPFETSFRCAPEILAAVDAAFRLPEVEAKLFTDDRSKSGPSPARARVRHAAARSGARGVVEWWPLTPRGEDPERPDAWAAPVDAPARGDSRVLLAEQVARQVRDWIRSGEGVADREAEKRGEPRLRPMRPGDVMILLRRRDAVFENVIRRLKAHGVPVAGADRMTLSAQLAVEDLLGAARAALLPDDDLALAELLRSPLVHPAHLDFPPIGEAALFDLAHGRPGRLVRALRETADPRFAEAKALVDDLIARAGREGPFAFLAGLLDRTSPTGESYARRLYHRLGPEAEDPVEELLARALAHERRSAPSLERFVHETLASDVEAKREGAGGSDAVRVMTVHGSKGLEAPVVIVPDQGQPGAGRQETWPWLEEDHAVWAPFRSGDAGHTLALREAREAAAEAERLRLLYVAMTRAEDRLVICAPEIGARKKDQAEPLADPESWHALVEKGLRAAGAAPCETPNGPGLRLGEARRAETAERGSGPSSPPAAPAVPPWTALPPPAHRRVRIVSPARGLSADAEAPPALSPVADGAGARFARGRLAHKLLQLLPDLAPDRRAEAGQRLLAAEGGLPPEAADGLLAETLAVIAHPDLAALFGPGSRGEVPLAGRVARLPDGVVVNGRVDRLVVTSHEVLIVDYKTDRPPPPAPEGASPLYLEQMAAYRALLEALYPGKVVRAALLWTDGPRLMALPPALLDARWEAALARARAERAGGR